MRLNQIARLRYYLRTGIGIGGVTGLLVGIFEFLYLLITATDYFSSIVDAIRMSLFTLVTLGGVGAILGVVLALLSAFLSSLIETGKKGNGAVQLAPPLLFSIAFAWPLKWVIWSLALGPRVARLPHIEIYKQTVLLIALLLLFFVARLALKLLRSSSTWSTRQRFIAFNLCFVAAAVLYLSDQRIFPRLYRPLHLALFVGCTLTIALGFAFGIRNIRRYAPLGLVLAIVGPVMLVMRVRDHGLRMLAPDRNRPISDLLRTLMARQPIYQRASVRSHEDKPPLPDAAPAPFALRASNVVLITIDAWRADRLNAQTTPFLSQFVKAGMRFTRAYAAVSHTSFSVATLLTGKHVLPLSEQGIFVPSSETLVSQLRKAKYHTAGFYPPAIFHIDGDRLGDFEQQAYGFETVRSEFVDAVQRTDQIIEFLEKAPSPTFVWSHYFEPHEPYLSHPEVETSTPTGQSPADRYDSEIRFVDRQISRLIDFLRTNRPHTIVVIASDHGEEFGEHGAIYHGTTLYEELLRVPLAIVSLDQNGEDGILPMEIAEPVGLVDVAPTLLHLLGIAPPRPLRGHNLVALQHLSQGMTSPPVFAALKHLETIISGNDKLICDLETDWCELFDLKHDPHERHNLSGQSEWSQRESELHTLLMDWALDEAEAESGVTH